MTKLLLRYILKKILRCTGGLKEHYHDIYLSEVNTYYDEMKNIQYTLPTNYEYRIILNIDEI